METDIGKKDPRDDLKGYLKERHETNPWAMDLLTRISGMDGGVKLRKVKATGAHTAIVDAAAPGGVRTRGVYEQVPVDADKWTKVYAAQLSIVLDKGLSSPAQKVLAALLTALENRVIGPNADVVSMPIGWLSQKDASGVARMSKSTAWRGLAELAKHAIIAPSRMEGHYFINPLYVFRGDRMVVVKEYVRKLPKEENKTGWLFDPDTGEIYKDGPRALPAAKSDGRAG